MSKDIEELMIDRDEEVGLRDEKEEEGERDEQGLPLPVLPIIIDEVPEDEAEIDGGEKVEYRQDIRDEDERKERDGEEEPEETLVMALASHKEEDCEAEQHEENLQVHTECLEEHYLRSLLEKRDVLSGFDYHKAVEHSLGDIGEGDEKECSTQQSNLTFSGLPVDLPREERNRCGDDCEDAFE